MGPSGHRKRCQLIICCETSVIARALETKCEPKSSNEAKFSFLSLNHPPSPRNRPWCYVFKHTRTDETYVVRGPTKCWRRKARQWCSTRATCQSTNDHARGKRRRQLITFLIFLQTRGWDGKHGK